MRKHLSFREKQDVLRNYSKSLGYNWSLTVPPAYTKIYNADLKNYDAKLGFDSDKVAHKAYGIWFESEEHYTWFLLRWS